jgi:hypothetical protein
MLIYHTVSAIMINTVSRAMVYNGDTAANVVLPNTQNFKKKTAKIILHPVPWPVYIEWYIRVVRSNSVLV